MTSHNSLLLAQQVALTISGVLLLGTLMSPPPAQAKSIQVEFVNDASSDIVEAVKETLPDIIAAETPLHARRQGRRAQAAVKDTLNAFGYYDPVIDIIIEEVDGLPRPGLTVDTGPLFRLKAVNLKFAAPEPRSEDIKALESDLTISPGDPAVPANVIDVERVLGTSLRRRGYAFSNVAERDIIGDKKAATLSVRYNIESGPRVRFGNVIFPENIRTKNKYLARLDPTKPGDIYTPAKVALYNSRLSETRLFSSSSAKLSPGPVGTSADGDAIHDIILDVKERPRNTIALGANYDTNEGFGVNAELTRRNITRRGDILIADTRLAQREVGLDLIWRRPNALAYGKGLVLTSAISDENTDAFDQQIFRVGAGYEVVKSQRFNYNFGVRGQYIRQIENEFTQDFQTLSTYAGFNLDQSDSLLDPRKGWRAEGRIVPTYAFGGTSNKPYARAVGQGRVYLPLDAKARFVIAGRLRAGVLFGAQAADVPGDDRFYAGGGGSVRGYGFQAIGPFDANDRPLGGRSLLDSSFETRWRYTDRIGLVAFMDAGNVSGTLYPKFDNLNVGAGLGLRYMTPAGPLRVDVATPLDPSERDDIFQIYISIGQAF